MGKQYYYNKLHIYTCPYSIYTLVHILLSLLSLLLALLLLGWFWVAMYICSMPLIIGIMENAVRAVRTLKIVL